MASVKSPDVLGGNKTSAVEKAKHRHVHWRIAAGKFKATREKRECQGKVKRKASVAVDIDSVMQGATQLQPKRKHRTSARVQRDPPRKAKKTRRMDGLLFAGRTDGTSELNLHQKDQIVSWAIASGHIRPDTSGQASHIQRQKGTTMRKATHGYREIPES